jgi:membrane protease YdiL (CAAX protease family)
MDISILFLAFYVGLLIYLANQSEIARYTKDGIEGHSYQQRITIVRWMLFGVIGMKFIYSLLILQWAYLSTSPEILKQLEVTLPLVDSRAASANFGLMLLAGFLSFRVIVSEQTRQSLRRIFGPDTRYDPDSYVHIAAIVLILCFVSFVFDQLVGSGGISGLAEEVGANGISVVALVFQDVLLVIGAFLGIGMAIRRELPQSLERLGLHIPTVQDALWGIGSGIALIGMSLIMAAIWSALVSPEQFAQQNAAGDQLTQAFNTLPLAFVLSTLAAVSEEVLFRGALQPVLGLPLASLVFALSHVQYALTPATLIVFVVGLWLGWLRHHRNTTTAIFAHFVYDFVQLAIQILVVQAAGGA